MSKAFPSIRTPPMEARLVQQLPEGDAWQYEPKWDGFRCVAHKDGENVDLRAKSGKSLNRYFPDVAGLIAKIETPTCILDGELLITIRGALSFEALQARLHPAASRVSLLAASQPAQFMAFDCLALGSVSLIDEPLQARRAKLEAILAKPSTAIVLSPFTRDRRVALKWLKQSGKALDGVIAKRLDGPYVPGERAMLKVKRLRTADCVIGGFRRAAGAKTIGSLLLGLYDADGLLHHVGFTSALGEEERLLLTRELKPLIGGAGFTGKRPSESRWNARRSEGWAPLKPRLVVEVQYDQVTESRFRHGTRLLRWRPDKKPAQCTFDQLASPAPPTEVAALLRGARRTQHMLRPGT
jgi:ATP-dependent DNA ligase